MRGGGRAADVDGRQGGGLGRDPAHRQARRDQRALAQCAPRHGRDGAPAQALARRVAGGGCAGRDGLRALLERGRGLLLRRPRRPLGERRGREAEPDIRRLAAVEPSRAGPPEKCRRGLREAPADLLRASQPRSAAPRLQGALPGRAAGARRRLSPGHGVGLAARALRARALQGLRRQGGGARSSSSRSAAISAPTASAVSARSSTAIRPSPPAAARPRPGRWRRHSAHGPS